ncbi:hypothetical protein [Gordonia soli]|uniref:Bifunctional glucose-6-phosphate/mannose-6-phosphate isomerase C-terminal domain-containing protein n=1 Tax=Gordonia soli NBRC 108243 TaxID=1223545 RepID=M0QDM5_9ACTN|nr:hypothetical protein [Gordonia soli]GAC66411.1 hypothetical protein GS4_02_01220 [Gordonia soli NBRC 108243]
MRTGAPDLDDVEELIAADVEGLLQSVALAGAQVRSVSEAQREGVLEPLAGLRPRSVVVVTGAGAIARDAVDLVVATVAARVDVPIVTAPTLPGWIGPLDVVVLAGDDAGDRALADAGARAGRRRAEIVILAPLEGPLREALGGNGIDLSPRVGVDPRFRFAGHVVALLAVFVALSEVRFTGSAPAIADIAETLDAEAATNHPSAESFRNRAKLLAARLDDRPVVWTGDTPASDAAARRAARAVLAIGGIVSAAAEPADVGRLVAEAARRSGSSTADSIFYDPEIDGPPPSPAPRVLVMSTPAREWTTRRRLLGLGEIEVITGAEADEVSSPAPIGPDESVTDTPADLSAYLVSLLRIEMAAVYLRLVGYES